MSHKRFGQLFKYRNYMRTLEKYSSIIYGAGEAWRVEYANCVNKLLAVPGAGGMLVHFLHSPATHRHHSFSWTLTCSYIWVVWRGCGYDVFGEAALVDPDRCPLSHSTSRMSLLSNVFAEKPFIYLFQIEESHLRAKGISDWLCSSARTSSVWTTVKAKLLYFLILMILANTCNGK